MTNNYFRSGIKIYFFDSKDDLSVMSAWGKAVAANLARLPAIYCPITTIGPWFGCPIIGFPPHGPRPDDAVDLMRWREHAALHDRLWAGRTSHVTHV